MANNCHFMFCHDKRNHFRLFSWDNVIVQKGRHCKTYNIFDTKSKTFPICRWQTIAISCFAMIEEITLDYFHGMLCLSKKVCIVWDRLFLHRHDCISWPIYCHIRCIFDKFCNKQKEKKYRRPPIYTMSLCSPKKHSLKSRSPLKLWV